MSHDSDETTQNHRGLSRRQFLRGVGAVGAGSTLVTDLLAPETAEAEPKPLESAPIGKALQPGSQPITLNVNGQAIHLEVEPRTTLVNALRIHAEPPLTGTKLVCDQGACGACTVLLDGKTAYGCMLLAVDVVGRKITTVEGLAEPDGKLSAVQEAFIDKDALMCGFCTPGFVLSVTTALQANPAATEDDIKKACSGNLCRCGTYPHIFEAALDAAKKMQGRA